MARTAPTDRSRPRLIATCAAAAGVALALQGCGGGFASAPREGRMAAPVAFEAPETAPPAAPTPATKPAARTKPASAAKAASATKAASAAKAASSTKRPGSQRGAAAILRGERQVYVVPVNHEGALAVSRAGRIELSDHFGDPALFVLTPTAGKHQIRTGTIRRGGEALCVSVRQNGTNPLTLTTTACDAGASSQLFTVTAAHGTYSIAAAGGAYVRLSSRSGVIVEETGDGPAPTAFRLVDQGQATLPALD